MIRAIIFDFGQTLVDASNGFRLAEKEAERQIFSHLKLPSWDDFLADYRKIRKDLHARSEFSRASLWRAVYDQYGVSVGSDLLNAWEDAYWATVRRETAPFPETAYVLTELFSKYQLAVITNTQGRGDAKDHRLWAVPDLERFFQVIIVAGEGRMPPKPHPKPFTRCSEMLNISLSHAVYVGDDWEIDICGAEAAGIQPIWIQHATVKRSWPSVETSVPIITSLSPLLDLEAILGLS